MFNRGNMRYKTVQDILDQAAAFHQRVAALADEAAMAQDRQRLGMLLDYLSDHQSQLKAAIEAFRDEGSQRVMETWFDRAPEIEVDELGQAELASMKDVDSLIKRVVDFHDQVIELYANLRDQAAIEEVEAVFADLAELERHEKMALIQGARQLQDI